MLSLYYILPILLIFVSHFYKYKSYSFNNKIIFNLPNNYIKRDIEDYFAEVAYNVKAQGVYVLYAPSSTGKTTAVKKVLKEIQSSNTRHKVTYYSNGNKFTSQIKLVPVYIDSLKDIKQLDFIKDIPDNKKVVLVVDHMSPEILDGFVNYDENNNIINSTEAESFYSRYAIQSYNGGLKYIMIIITNNEEYALNILQINGRSKVHEIPTSNKRRELHYRACELLSVKLKIRLDNYNKKNKI
jgi:Cdc6-like AAA superfamily ATPase